MRALVTGAAGFVGTHLLSHLIESGDEVIACFAPGQECKLKVPSLKFDITNYNDCIDAISKSEVDVIYHLAGIAFVPDAENDFAKVLSINVGGTQNIMRAAHLAGRNATVVLASSAEVYGKVASTNIPVSEKHPIRPANNYSLTKAMAEMVVNRYNDLGTVKGVILRPYNHIGASQDKQFVASSFAYQLALISKKKAPAIIKVGNLSPQRDFSDVRDIVRAYRLASMKGSGMFILGRGQPTAIQEILSTLIDISGLTVKIEQDPERTRPAEVPVLYADITKAKSELGWQPKYTLRESLEEVYSYWLSQS